MRKITCITLITAMVITAGGFGYLYSDKKDNAITKSINAQSIKPENESSNIIPARKAEYKKDENIYGILNTDGSLSEMYVVNQFEVKKSGIIEDFGEYDVITNLTNTDEITSKNSTQILKAEKGYFYYQGTITKADIPWHISIKYFLNDKKISAKEMAGKSGEFKVKIKIHKNTKANIVFYENYMLQAALTLDNDKASNINAPGAQIADAGTAKQINFTCLPEKNNSYTLTADVKDFQMSGI